jgi:hypothetical protein
MYGCRFSQNFFPVDTLLCLSRKCPRLQGLFVPHSVVFVRLIVFQSFQGFFCEFEICERRAVADHQVGFPCYYV